MSGDEKKLEGPDLTAGIHLAELADGAPLLGHAGGEAVMMVRRGDDVFAIGATCTHYSGPLAEGLVVGETVRCPWHHACFNLRTGEAVRAPALNPVPCWEVARRDGKAFVTRKVERAPLAPASAPARGREPAPTSIGIIGAGAAGSAAAEMLRREGYEGAIAMFDPDPSAPYDRPNLSKDYLAGNAPEEWIPLRPDGFYAEHGIEVVRRRVARLDARGKRVTLDDGSERAFDRLLLATGADPVRLSLPGADRPNVHYLRTLADSRAIIAAAEDARRALVMGASFIGLEVAASLRARGLEVHVVAPETVPFERILGREMGEFIQALHEEKGVHFHLGTTATGIGERTVELKNGESVPADLVVIGVGVRPTVALAEEAGLTMDRGVVVNDYLETSAPGVFAAGDIARWPDPHSGGRIRVEHWVVAQRQGQTAARNLIGAGEPFRAVPFFWSAHYDVSINYVGHAERWDQIDVTGDIGARDCAIAYRSGGKTLAVASIFRDRESLEAEAEMERDDWAALRELVPAR
ncbi:MAG TPA: FAD-dependent oxidoreductase [Gemmatimonadaceae bacterium]